MRLSETRPPGVEEACWHLESGFAGVAHSSATLLVALLTEHDRYVAGLQTSLVLSAPVRTCGPSRYSIASGSASKWTLFVAFLDTGRAGDGSARCEDGRGVIVVD